MGKLQYVEPEMEITLFDSEDVITTSGIELPDDEWGIELPEDEW